MRAIHGAGPATADAEQGTGGERRDLTEAFRLAPAFDSDRAAEALHEFLEEARAILDGIEDAYQRGRDARPAERVRRDILRVLADANEEVELHELPSVSGVGIGLRRSYVQEMAAEELLTARRGQAYPNMLYLSITPKGREELRRLGVKEAMVWLHGADASTADTKVADAIGQARTALSRLVDAIGA